MNTSPDSVQAIESHTGALVALALSTFLAALSVSSVNIALPVLVSSLNTSFSQVQWITLSYLAVLTATLVIAGRLSDTLGKKRLFAIGVTVFTLAASLAPMAQNLWQLVILRGIQGSGAATMIVVNMAILSDIFPRKRLGAAMGLIGSMSAIGTGSGPVLGGLLIDHLNWQAIFLVNLPLGLLVLTLASKHLPEDTVKQAHRPTATSVLAGSVLFCALVVYTLAARLAGQEIDSTSVWLILGFVSLLLVFIYLDIKSDAPLINLSQLDNKTLFPSLISNFIVSIVVMSSLVIGPFYLTLRLELSTSAAGLVMVASPVTVAVTSYLVGRLAQRFSLERILLSGLLIIALGASGMSVLSLSHGLQGFMLGLVVIGSGYATFVSSNNTLTMRDIPAHLRGSVSGILNLSRNLGLLTGVALMSAVFDANSQISATSVAHLSLDAGVNAVYRLALVLLAVSVMVQILFQRKSRR